MNDELIRTCQASIAAAIYEIQQPRTPTEIAAFVVGQHDMPGRQWAQCTLEIQLKISALRRAQISERQLQRRIARLEARGTEAALDKAELLRIDLEDQSLAVLGAVRELQALYSLWQSMKPYTRDELNAEEPEYWKRRLSRQAAQDIAAHGRVGVGNQDALRMFGEPTPGQQTYVGAVESRFLEVGRMRVLVAVPTMMTAEQVRSDGLACLAGWELPGTVEYRVYVVNGRPVADAYTDAAIRALDDGAEFLLTVEDDHEIPAGTFERLMDLWRREGPRAIVGAWYPQRREIRTGAPIVIRAGRREFLDDDGSVHEVYGCPMGFTIIPTAIFNEVPQPWFVTTGCLTQDSFFSQLAREAGYKLLIDTAARIKHVCRETGRVYE